MEGAEIGDEAYTGDGALINSDFFNGLNMADGKAKMIEWLEANGRGKGVTNYRLRDWGCSRQRYWGCPIPIIKCEPAGTVPVPADQLPVKLPEDVTFDKPGNPLDHHPTWKHTTCPKCGGAAPVKPTPWIPSSIAPGIFCAIAAPGRQRCPAGCGGEILDECRPICRRRGTCGAPSALFPLFHARDAAAGLCGGQEPFGGMYTQGMVTHETYKSADGWLYPHEVKQVEGTWQTPDGKPVEVGQTIKMSKSKRNTVSPMDIIEAYGADAGRWFSLSDSAA